jgi:hypothetical protein
MRQFFFAGKAGSAGRKVAVLPLFPANIIISPNNNFPSFPSSRLVSLQVAVLVQNGGFHCKFLLF